MADGSSTLRVSGVTRQKMAALRAQAKAAGMTADAYASRLLEEAIALEQEARATPFDALFAPVQRRFRESGMSEAELDALVDAARKRHHRRTSRKKA
jgi:hypothetical protein